MTLIEPLMTEVATIKIKTPKLMPSIEASETKDNNRLCFFAKENLNPIKKDSGRRMNCLILLIQRKVCFDRFLILTKNHSRSACLCKSLCTVLKLTGAKGVETSSEIERRDLPALFRSRILFSKRCSIGFSINFPFS